MFTSRYFVDAVYSAIFLVSLGVVIEDLWMGLKRSNTSRTSDASPIRWRTGIAIITLAWLPIVIAVISGGF